jgi:hypothetical protein
MSRRARDAGERDLVNETKPGKERDGRWLVARRTSFETYGWVVLEVCTTREAAVEAMCRAARTTQPFEYAIFVLMARAVVTTNVESCAV